MLVRAVLFSSIALVAAPSEARQIKQRPPEIKPVIWKEALAVTAVRQEQTANWRLTNARYDVPAPTGATIKVKGRNVDVRVPF